MLFVICRCLVLCRLCEWSSVCWQPAASQIQDIPRLVRLLQSVLACPQSAGYERLLEDLVEKLPAVQQLGAAEWYTVLSTILSGVYTFEGMQDLPGIQQLDAQQLEVFLLKCIEKQLWGDAQILLMLPAAQLLPTATVVSMLEQCLRALPSDRPLSEAMGHFWLCVFGLPQASGISGEELQRLWDVALDTGLLGFAAHLVNGPPQAPQCCLQVTGQRMCRALLAAIKRVPKGGDLMVFGVWLEEDRMSLLDTGSCVLLIIELLQLSAVLGGVHKRDSDSFGSWYQHTYEKWAESPEQAGNLLQLLQAILLAPACQNMQVSDVVNIMQTCLEPTWHRACHDSSIEGIAQQAGLNGLGHASCAVPVRTAPLQQHAAVLALLAVTASPAAAGVELCQL